MKKARNYLAAIGAITLFAIASVVPASDYHGGAHWRHHAAPNIIFGDAPRRYSGVGPRRYFGQGRRYFGVESDRYFGVGPGSYECFGYDCNW
jgi:fatty acid desaturase